MQSRDGVHDQEIVPISPYPFLIEVGYGNTTNLNVE